MVTFLRAGAAACGFASAMSSPPRVMGPWIARPTAECKRAGRLPQRRAFQNETAMSARNIASHPAACALESPLPPAHPQRLAADSQHARDLGLAVRVLETLDHLADVLLDGERPRATR